jgi:ATP-dependent protease ClpP protease subunit
VGDFVFTMEDDDQNGIYDSIYKKLLKQNIIYFNGEINNDTIDYIAVPILMKNAEEMNTPTDELQPLTIWLNSYGGNADQALYLVGLIQNSRIPIHVKVLSVAASAGLYITLACHFRVASKNSLFLLHKGSYSFDGNAGEVEDAMGYYKNVADKKFTELIINRSKLTLSKLKAIRRTELYVLGEDALKEYGFIDEIVD